MKFSFVLPIYNVENYLERCIESVINQSFTDFEVLLVDDGSTDNSYCICKKYASVHSNVKLFRKDNGGLSDARNYGMERASGDYIIFVDSDDYIELSTCATLLPYTKENPDIIRCNAVRVECGTGLLHTEHRESDKPCTGEVYLKEMMAAGQMPMAAWLNVYSRAFLERENLKFKKGILHEDEEFTPRAFLKAKTVVNTEFVFYYYVIRENSITTQKDKRKNAKDMLSTCYELEAIFSDISDDELKIMLLDSLVSKYLSLYQEGNLARYGNEYLPKAFLKRNSFSSSTRFKSFLVCLSPRLYGIVHQLFVKFKTSNFRA